MIRYDDMRIDRLLAKEYQKELAHVLGGLSGLNDIEAALKDFERTFAAYIGTRHALAVNSGTDALQMALLTLGVGKGDSVIVPSLTYPAVALSVLYAGARPLIVDVKDDLQMDEALVARRWKKDVKAVIAPHMFARPCAIKAVVDLAHRHGAKVIEDCCQAESSILDGGRLGSFADMSCFSFSYYKPLSSCGGGGGVVCFNDPAYGKMADLTRIWADHEALARAGQRFARMNLLDLVAVRVKWSYLKDIIKSRVAAKKIYEEGLASCRYVTFFKDPAGASSVPQNFVILSKERDALGVFLRQEGVSWQAPYTPLHQMKIFRRYGHGAYAQADRYARTAIQLPLYSFMKVEDAGTVVAAVKRFYGMKG